MKIYIVTRGERGEGKSVEFVTLDRQAALNYVHSRDLAKSSPDQENLSAILRSDQPVTLTLWDTREVDQTTLIEVEL